MTKHGRHTETAYITLQSAIRSGDLSPNERLVESTLMERFELSRAAIRIALVKLEQDGVVVRERNRGARVRSVSVDEAIEILEMRAAVDGLAARHAAKRASDAEVAELRRLGDDMARASDDGDLLTLSTANARLDQRVVELSRHETVQRVARMLNSHMVRFQYSPMIMAGRPSVSVAEHRAIIEAIANHDPDAAEQAVRTHLEHVIETFRQRLSNVATFERRTSLESMAAAESS